MNTHINNKICNGQALTGKKTTKRTCFRFIFGHRPLSKKSLFVMTTLHLYYITRVRNLQDIGIFLTSIEAFLSKILHRQTKHMLLQNYSVYSAGLSQNSQSSVRKLRIPKSLVIILNISMACTRLLLLLGCLSSHSKIPVVTEFNNQPKVLADWCSRCARCTRILREGFLSAPTEGSSYTNKYFFQVQ